MSKWETLLKDYQAGKLNTTDQELVSEKLAELNALQDYLWEQEKLALPTKEDVPKIDRKKIKKQVNRKFLHLVVAVFSCLALLGLVVYFAVVPLVEKAYFDPRKTQPETPVTDYLIYQTLYNELTNPKLKVEGMAVEKIGLADYQVRTWAAARFKNSDPSVESQVRIKRNEVSSQDSLFNQPNYTPLLKWGADDQVQVKAMAENLNTTLTKLTELPKSAGVKGVLSLAESQPVSVLRNFFGAGHLAKDDASVSWLSVEVESPRGERENGLVLGLNLSDGLGLFPPKDAYAQKLNQDYPELFPYSFAFSREEFTPETYETHFKSVLRYLIDHEEMLPYMNNHVSLDLLKEALAYVEEEGLKINAVYLQASGPEFMKLAQTLPTWHAEIIDVDLFRQNY